MKYLGVICLMKKIEHSKDHPQHLVVIAAIQADNEVNMLS